jgi:pimeloyl-ACP methyl ester carboxylesterase
VTTFVLIHGGFHGGWCWDLVVPYLEGAGHTVLAPDLPGMGQDKTPHRDISLDSCAKFVVDLLSTLPDGVVVVGHSMGGHVIAQAAEMAPEKIAGLIYVTAVLLPAGVSPIAWRGEDVASVAGGATLSEDGASVMCHPEFAMERFLGMAPRHLAEDAIGKLGPQPLLPFVTPSSVTPERFGRIPRVYIECEHDKVLSLEEQALLQSYWPCAATFRMDSDHSPFISAPRRLSELIIAASELFRRKQC